MPDPVLDAVNELRGDMRNLIQGLMLLSEGIGAQTELLNTLVDAATEEPNGDNPTAEALRHLVTAVSRNTAQLATMREAMTGATLRGAMPQPA